MLHCCRGPASIWQHWHGVPGACARPALPSAGTRDCSDGIVSSGGLCACACGVEVVNAGGMCASTVGMGRVAAQSADDYALVDDSRFGNAEIISHT